MSRSLSCLLLFGGAAFLASAACSQSNDDGSSSAGSADCPPKAEEAPLQDKMTYPRVLRRAVLAVTGGTPSPEDYEKIAALPNDEARDAFVDEVVDAALKSPEFYDKMVEFGHEWLRVASYTAGAVGESYQGNQSADLFRCPAESKHPAAYHLSEPSAICNDTDAGGAPISPRVATVEPWWAPGTTVTVLGDAGTNVRTIERDGKPLDCGASVTGDYYSPNIANGCSCGPNLVWCFPFHGLESTSNFDETKQRRHAWEEPARMFAHVVWYDRPLSDVVLGNYSVGTNMLRALYLRHGRQAEPGLHTNLDDLVWWKPSADPSPRDPRHPEPEDPNAWREFVVSTLNPNLLSLSPGDAPSGSVDRTYVYDARTAAEPPKGFGAAGVLTSMGYLSSFARERPRAARALEIFACREFTPPDSNLVFPPYDKDPATSGTCMNCHQALDPAAIFFKRWDFGGENYYVPTPIMPDIGKWLVTKEQLSGQYPYSGAPFTRWIQSWTPGTVLTPVTPEQIAARPGAIFLDTIPAGQSYMGVTSDGTNGPLGFAKILVKSGEFDACLTSRLYERFVGRKLDSGTEALYLKTLTAKFVEGGRQLRPFVKQLVRLDEFRRGI